MKPSASCFRLPRLLFALLACLFLIPTFAWAEDPEKINLDHPYVLQLLLTDKPINPTKIPDLPALRDHRLYVESYKKGGKTWHRLRLGFFRKAAHATKLQSALEKHFPGNWVTKASEAERAASAKSRILLPGERVVRQPKVDVSYPYAIQLMLSGRPVDPARLPNLPIFRDYRLYVSHSVKNGKDRYALRLGFFRTSKIAADYQIALNDAFPGNWVLRVDKDEREGSLAHQVALSAPPVSAAPTPIVKTTLSAEEAARLKELMTEGRRSIAKKRYQHAIRTFEVILSAPVNELTQDAREMLGVARERNGQFAHAVSEYERYLEQYPKGSGADRVRQRLAGLLTAPKASREKLRAGKAKDADIRWEYYGGISQFYRRDVITDGTGSRTIQESSLATDLDLTARRRGGDWNIRSRFSGDHRYDFLGRKPVSELRITTLYMDANSRSNPFSARIGRQTQSSGGVLGRFDGAVAGVQLHPKFQFNVVAGLPTEWSTSDTIQTDKYFYGANTDLGTFFGAWDMNLFFIQQVTTGEVDRRAVGGELRYIRLDRSLFTLVDYDLLYQDLNTVLVMGNVTLPDNSTLNVVYDQRNSPILTTSNALQGQPEFELDALIARVGEATAQDLARDRTAHSRSITLGGSHPLSDKYTINADLTVTNLSGTPASGGVPAVPATGNEYFLSTQLVADKLWLKNDVSIVGYRLAMTNTASTHTLSFNSRFPLAKFWRMNPRMRIDYRDNSSDRSKQYTIIPSVRTDIRVGKRMRLEMELGGDWTHNQLPTTTETTYGYFLNLGYRLDF